LAEWPQAGLYTLSLVSQHQTIVSPLIPAWLLRYVPAVEPYLVVFAYSAASNSDNEMAESGRRDKAVKVQNLAAIY
jgi:hypothetical protein